MSRLVTDLKNDLNLIQRQLPEAGYIFTKEEVKALVDYFGSWLELAKVMGLVEASDSESPTSRSSAVGAESKKGE